MKKLAYVLGFLFMAGMGMTTYASTVVVENDVNITVVNQNDDEKPCPKGCTCEKCTKAKADCKATKADCKTAKTDCKSHAKCDKAAKSCCKNSKKTTEKATTPTKK